MINDSSIELRNRCGENAEVGEAIDGGRSTLVFDDPLDTTSDGPELERRCCTRVVTAVQSLMAVDTVEPLPAVLITSGLELSDVTRADAMA